MTEVQAITKPHPPATIEDHKEVENSKYYSDNTPKNKRLSKELDNLLKYMVELEGIEPTTS